MALAGQGGARLLGEGERMNIVGVLCPWRMRRCVLLVFLLILLLVSLDVRQVLLLAVSVDFRLERLLHRSAQISLILRIECMGSLLVSKALWLRTGASTSARHGRGGQQGEGESKLATKKHLLVSQLVSLLSTAISFAILFYIHD